MNKKLQKIFQKNTEFEKESPYNFCDRWCERCIHEKQIRCKLYLDEFEQKITCIAHGREPDDLEMTAEVMDKQYEALNKIMEKYEEEIEADFDEIDDPKFEDIVEHSKSVENDSLLKTAEQYYKKAQFFLKETFYDKNMVNSGFIYDFQTVSWYHTLLLVKLQRALAGFHKPGSEDEFAFYDMVAQFEICKKAIKLSVEALRKIDKDFIAFHKQILELIVLLHNIYSRIEVLENSI